MAADPVVPNDDYEPLGVIGWVDADALIEQEDWAAVLQRQQLVDVLEAAFESGIEYGPLLPGRRLWTAEYEGPIPARFRLAQARHARDIARASYTDQNGQVGPEGFTVTVWPMDRTIQRLYRPRRAGRRGPR